MAESSRCGDGGFRAQRTGGCRVSRGGRQKVLVLERNAWFGGGVVSRDLTVPGFHHDQHSMAHIFIQANPLLVDDELQLKARYGLKYLFPDPPCRITFRGRSDRSRSIGIGSEPAPISRSSRRRTPAPTDSCRYRPQRGCR